MAQTRPKYVQVYEPKTKRWVKVSTLTGRITGRKSTAGAFTGIPKRKNMPRRRKATGARMQPAAKPPQRRRKAATKKPAPGRKIKYKLPEKRVSMVYDTQQSAIGGGTAKKTTRTRTRRKPDRQPDVIPTNIKDLGRANVKTQLVRVKCDRLQKLPVIDSPDVAADILAGMAKNDREEMRVLYLNAANRVIGVETAHIGSVDASISSPHEVYKTALLLNASGVVLAHNHPSGNPKPSTADLRNATEFKNAGKVVEIKLLDSLIIGDGKYYSLNQEGDL